MREIKIYCPKCQYVPRPADRWTCVRSCGCLWHTFDTCGVCPKCGKNWIHTQCPACHRRSPHVDWYHELIPKEQGTKSDQQVVEQPLEPATSS